MSNQAIYNRPFHVRAQGPVHSFLGDLKKAKSGVFTRSCVLSIPAEGWKHDWRVVCLLYGETAATAQVDSVVECCGPVVDYGTRMEGKSIKPKLVFAASTHCEKPGEYQPTIVVAVSGRVGWVGAEGLAKVDGGRDYTHLMDIGVYAGDFPAMIGLRIKGHEALNVRKHMMIFAEARVTQFGLSEDKKRPAIKAEAYRTRIAFLCPEPKQGDQQ